MEKGGAREGCFPLQNFRVSLRGEGSIWQADSCVGFLFGVERGGRGIEVSVQVFPLFLSVFFFPTASDQFSKSGYSHLFSSPLLFRLFFSLIFGERMRGGEISVVFFIPSAFRPSPRGRGGVL